ncbi:prolyl-tRNA editing protein [Companilactobacillus crustorum]|uniref:YbaK prolyl-tRNA synthetase associated domain-containing protein n=3 Tax=Companilactobacillus TaxID=2767879 RepID=A0A837RFG3_9LACO|nr:prolyl-tRNA synthetase associated domain-containing protein [Companilactobacillus crustorum]HCD08312.1 prolyl-tRNA synthetase associated domain-containing protein [Lactobacillus sp.]KRK41627.1 YbaK prolyl-tRNA synthetase associated domain-containing protein [Companilactobacillus crustorum JCM 15951]KRO19415.1 YbaK prolyl-tRNA synthetase associated domain-containing protein [Companilactobacillus crustorum]WDT65537.1 prolyl-tRNA synthetase associated domain-containing protein [Companilactobaci
MNPYEQVKAELDKLDIKFDMVEHPAVYTSEEADKYVVGKAGMKVKSLFLTDNKKRNFYLVFMADDKRLDMKKFAERVNEKHIKFASEKILFDKLGLRPGFVSIFGLLNNSARDVKVYFEKSIIGELPLTFHPNDNTKTLFVKMSDLKKFLNDLGYEYNVIEM